MKTRGNLYVTIPLIIMWAGLMALFFFYGHQLTTHPCSLCSEKIGEDIRCFTGAFGGSSNQMTFYPNGSIDLKSQLIQKSVGYTSEQELINKLLSK